MKPPNIKRSQAQEKKTAKELNGKVTPASGSKWHSKGDIRTDKFLVEVKTTTKPQYRLTLETWEKIYKEALRDGMRIPVMRIDLTDAWKNVHSFAVIGGDVFLEMGTMDIGSRSKVMDRQVSGKKSFLLKTTASTYQYLFVLERREPSGSTKMFSLVAMPWKEFVEYANQTTD